MFYLDNGSGVETMPEPANRMSSVVRFFTEGDNLNAASYPGQDWFNIVQSELLNILKLANIDPNKATYNQLATAIQAAIDVVGNSAVRLETDANGKKTVNEPTDFKDLKQNGSNVITKANIGEQLSEIGVNQAWQDVKSQRAVNVTYTNTTGKPIQIYVMVETTGNVATSIEIDGTSMGFGWSLQAWVVTMNVIIPSGSTYKVRPDGVSSIYRWNELR